MEGLSNLVNRIIQRRYEPCIVYNKEVPMAFSACLS